MLNEIARPYQYVRCIPPVYFRAKIKKLLTGEGLKSARQHLRRSRHKPAVPLETAAIIQTIDRDRFERIRQRYAVENPGEDWPKYLDLNRWIDINIRRVRRSGLDISLPQRVLDLGAGAGYFAYIAQLLGHEVTGLDIDEVRMFADMTSLLGVKRIIHRVQPFVPLPDLGTGFDLVTGFQVCFNNHKQPDLWGIAEWNFFLDDLVKHLAPGGRVWLELNRERDGDCYTPELKEFFQQRGARIDNHRVAFNPILPAPSAISPTAR
jgi:SAM-dependent methyltransferase